MQTVTAEGINMVWDKKKWLQKKKKSSNPMGGGFIFGAQDYDSEVKGKPLSVFFSAGVAFLWVSDAHTEDEDIWTAEELISWCKSNLSAQFPSLYDECVVVASSDGLNMDIIDEYGLTPYVDDIQARYNEIVEFTQEVMLG